LRLRHKTTTEEMKMNIRLEIRKDRKIVSVFYTVIMTAIIAASFIWNTIGIFKILIVMTGIEDWIMNHELIITK
jgi:hypothetical protein